jgi:hypothetical protein
MKEETSLGSAQHAELDANPGLDFTQPTDEKEK